MLPIFIFRFVAFYVKIADMLLENMEAICFTPDELLHKIHITTYTFSTVYIQVTFMIVLPIK